jgi:hypothetical protein
LIEKRGKARETVLAALFFAGSTLLATLPLVLHLSDGSGDLWDAKLNAWILHWDFHQTFRDPTHLFDANIFYPARYALAFSENLFGAAVFGFGLYAAGVSTLTVYNALFLLGMFLSALAAWALAREVTGDAAASLIAGVVYAYVPWRMSQIPHIQFQWGAFLPLLLLFLVRYFEAGRRRDLVLFAVCFAWNALANVHYAIFSGALLAVALLFESLAGPAVSRRRVLRALLAVGVAGAAVSPFFFPYAKAARLYGMERSYSEMEFYSGRAVEFLSAGSRNWLYGAVTRRFAHAEGDFFPGLVPAGLSVLAIQRLRRKRPDRAGPAADSSDAGTVPPSSRRQWVRGLDLALIALLLLFVAALARPGLRIGFVRLGDPGRLIVLASAVVFLRLAVAFPRRSRFRDLGDFVRRGPMDRRVALFLAIAGVGVLMALGAHTPYYGFLFRSLSFIFRAIRAPARAIVLFHLALAVLSAWGLSLLAGRARSLRRCGLLAAALLLTGVEYRAFPIRVFPVEAEPAPVYRWLAGVPLSGGVMEWPLGDIFDFEYEFRSTAHWKPLVNGSSGFGPPAYRELRGLLSQMPIPDATWQRVASLDAGLLIFHPHDAPSGVLLSYTRAARRAVALGELEVWKTFPHGVDTDYVFRITSGPAFDAGVAPEQRREAAEKFARLSIRPGGDPSPPRVALDFPPANFELRAGEWAYGWALDDSGVLEVRVSTELGPVGPAAYGGPRPDVGKVFPYAADSARSGFGFQIPKLPPGPHTLIVTVVAKDEGQTVLRRAVRVR